MCTPAYTWVGVCGQECGQVVDKGCADGGVYTSPSKMATATGGMHPTGMLSCLIIFP